MRKPFINILTGAGIILALVTFASCKKDPGTNNNGTGTNTGTTTGTTGTTGTTTDTTTYTLLWSDEFNGTKVDDKVWNFETGNLNVNNEDEYYKAENASVASGNLVITAERETNGTQNYTSARLNTLGKIQAQYGRVEARIKIPLGLGMWPAFWMMGTNIGSVSWPTCGELDIMEHVNANSTFYGTMHWNGGGGHVSYGLTTDISNPGDYHVYAIEWDKNSIRWYIDKTLYMTGNIKDGINNTAAFQKPFFILLNLAVGGDFPGQNIDTSIFPAKMYVDYVRVYKAN